MRKKINYKILIDFGKIESLVKILNIDEKKNVLPKERKTFYYTMNLYIDPFTTYYTKLYNIQVVSLSNEQVQYEI